MCLSLPELRFAGHVAVLRALELALGQVLTRLRPDRLDRVQVRANLERPPRLSPRRGRVYQAPPKLFLKEDGDQRRRRRKALNDVAAYRTARAYGG